MYLTKARSFWRSNPLYLSLRVILNGKFGKASKGRNLRDNGNQHRCNGIAAIPFTYSSPPQVQTNLGYNAIKLQSNTRSSESMKIKYNLNNDLLLRLFISQNNFFPADQMEVTNFTIKLFESNFPRRSKVKHNEKYFSNSLNKLGNDKEPADDPKQTFNKLYHHLTQALPRFFNSTHWHPFENYEETFNFVYRINETKKFECCGLHKYKRYMEWYRTLKMKCLRDPHMKILQLRKHNDDFIIEARWQILGTHRFLRSKKYYDYNSRFHVNDAGFIYKHELSKLSESNIEGIKNAAKTLPQLLRTPRPALNFKRTSKKESR